MSKGCSPLQNAAAQCFSCSIIFASQSSVPSSARPDAVRHHLTRSCDRRGRHTVILASKNEMPLTTPASPPPAHLRFRITSNGGFPNVTTLDGRRGQPSCGTGGVQLRRRQADPRVHLRIRRRPVQRRTSRPPPLGFDVDRLGQSPAIHELCTHPPLLAWVVKPPYQLHSKRVGHKSQSLHSATFFPLIGDDVLPFSNYSSVFQGR
ncbi:hypothetical protein J2850_000521 [Azospirillum picis]|uniref:Uncharacterized protein n=1 Tax=Azospirillum picis TaxID=488438 RepID=A0ABU0ME22_9PROT|nr:hypothetical protein [Azospirillum picis]MDQ0531685.1 hypothetical protein [Azospirillum picis]